MEPRAEDHALDDVGAFRVPAVRPVRPNASGKHRRLARVEGRVWVQRLLNEGRSELDVLAASDEARGARVVDGHGAFPPDVPVVAALRVAARAAEAAADDATRSVCEQAAAIGG